LFSGEDYSLVLFPFSSLPFQYLALEILKSLIRRKIKCRETLWLIDTILDNNHEQIPIIDYFIGDNLLTPIQRKKGLPIGKIAQHLSARYIFRVRSESEWYVSCLNTSYELTAANFGFVAKFRQNFE
jgi:hypothetical protein